MLRKWHNQNESPSPKSKVGKKKELSIRYIYIENISSEQQFPSRWSLGYLTFSPYAVVHKIFFLNLWNKSNIIHSKYRSKVKRRTDVMKDSHYKMDKLCVFWKMTFNQGQ